MKKVFDIIDFSVPEELNRYLKFMRIKRFWGIMSWMEYDRTERKSTLMMFIYII
jgi:hypothetical protein